MRKNRLFAMTLMTTALCLRSVSWTQEASEPQERIDLTSASAKELETLPGVGPVTAQIIIDTRERNGGFRCVEELLAMPRMSLKDFERIRPLVTVSGGRPAGCPSVRKIPGERSERP